ncbi:hypothetical protein CC86DRAFT_24194 [Ophiobolus disseminans]|uniref:Integral membrane protein n=1 Tax=Ophiobolus disseminans TaxID=1469910 RepID=A0A6A7A1A5_9PLEO|nr:hypothetical protein CC86DRAFT_24194 [Ophiobolus disseminans]
MYPTTRTNVCHFPLVAVEFTDVLRWRPPVLVSHLSSALRRDTSGHLHSLGTLAGLVHIFAHQKTLKHDSVHLSILGRHIPVGRSLLACLETPSDWSPALTMCLEMILAAGNWRRDYQIAGLAAGFTIGFGCLTVWEAIKQTRRNRNPLRSIYIYMVWGEILVNVIIAIIAWLFLNGKLGPTVPILFFILFFWVFQIQLLMQIIINRIALIAEHRSTVAKLKWGTVVIITAINIAVFVIWIPAHTVPPISETFVKINNVWDKISKVLILIVDAGLNWYFLRTVQIRLVKQNGLKKYAPLISFNAKLMILSIGMDALLIGLMFLKNQVVYIQFHPVVYIVKLNIEMSMASLVVRLAQGKPENDMYPEEFHSSSNHPTGPQSHLRSGNHAQRVQIQSIQMKSNRGRNDVLNGNDSDESLGGIHCQTDLNVVVERVEPKKGEGSSRSSQEAPYSVFDDDYPLHKEKMQANARKM